MIVMGKGYKKNLVRIVFAMISPATDPANIARDPLLPFESDDATFWTAQNIFAMLMPPSTLSQSLAVAPV